MHVKVTLIFNCFEDDCVSFDLHLLSVIEKGMSSCFHSYCTFVLHINIDQFILLSHSIVKRFSKSGHLLHFAQGNRSDTRVKALDFSPEKSQIAYSMISR